MATKSDKLWTVGMRGGRTVGALTCSANMEHDGNAAVTSAHPRGRRGWAPALPDPGSARTRFMPCGNPHRG